MIYSDITFEQVNSKVKGAPPTQKVGFVFYGKTIDEQFWKERITQYMENQKNISYADVCRFFAKENWTRTSAVTFYRNSADQKKV